MKRNRGSIDAAGLAAILHEEFERDGWGDIDPDLFRVAAAGEDDDDSDEDDEDAEGMRAVLERVAARLNEVPR